MDFRQVESDLDTLTLSDRTNWQERWLAGERLRQLGPQFARLALAGEALAAAVTRVLHDDHRRIDMAANPKHHLCVHSKWWFEECPACVDAALTPALTRWEEEVKALARVEATAPWSQPGRETAA